MYCLSVSKEQKEVFQIYFYLYCVTSVVREEIKCRGAENVSRLGYKHICVNYLHVASHDYEEVIQHTHTQRNLPTVSEFKTQLKRLCSLDRPFHKPRHSHWLVG